MESEMDDSKTQVYTVNFYFRGRRIAEECEPPTNLIEDFLDMLANSLIHEDWNEDEGTFIEHDYCTEECAIETCIIMGRPYTCSLREALIA